MNFIHSGLGESGDSKVFKEIEVGHHHLQFKKRENLTPFVGKEITLGIPPGRHRPPPRGQASGRAPSRQWWTLWKPMGAETLLSPDRQPHRDCTEQGGDGSPQWGTASSSRSTSPRCTCSIPPAPSGSSRPPRQKSNSGRPLPGMIRNIIAVTHGIIRDLAHASQGWMTGAVVGAACHALSG